MIDPVKADDRKEERGEQRAMQAGARLYPVPRFPKQDLPKLGEKGRPRATFRRPLLQAFWEACRQGHVDHRR
jgi:hypothetical protein